MSVAAYYIGTLCTHFEYCCCCCAASQSLVNGDSSSVSNGILDHDGQEQENEHDDSLDDDGVYSSHSRSTNMVTALLCFLYLLFEN